jgi:synaptotagmin-like protein
MSAYQLLISFILVQFLKIRNFFKILQTRSDSMASVYSAAGDARYGTVAVRGEIQFGLHYNYRQTALEVFVKQCKDLAPVDTKRNRSDP